MRCPLCGAEFFGGDGTCPGCGNYVGLDPNYGSSPNSNAPGVPPAGGQYYPPGGFSPNYGNPYMPAQQKVKTSLSKPASIVVVVCIILALGLFFFLTMQRGKPKEFDFGSFSMTLPSDLEEQSGSKFASAILAMPSFSGSEAAEYLGSGVRFAYVVTPDLGSAGSSSFTPDQLIDAMSVSYSSANGYEEISKSGDTLKFKMKNEDKSLTYCHIRVSCENNRAYILFLVCNENQQSKYKDKFDTWMSSFKTK